MVKKKKINAYVLSTVMAAIAVADGGFACENCQNAETPAAASVSVVNGCAPLKYSSLLFGYFIEHFDTVVYGGIYDPSSPLSDEDGFRKDVIDALRDAKCSIVRWPGGCFSQAYHWKNGIGPKREPAWDRAWRCEDPNTFGTDEYVKWCRKIGCEPYICTNAGTGTGEEMGEWVEYCNLPDAGWGRRRVANGHKDPYAVKYWNIGNENGGGHEIARRSAEEWGPLVRESAKMMRAVDSSIFVVGAGSPITEPWNRSLLTTAGHLIDMISVHSYPDKLLQVDNPSPYLKCMMFTDRAEKLIANVSRMLDGSGCGGGKVGIAIDEWNLRSWHHPGFGMFGRGQSMDVAARRRNDRAATYTMADAIYAATFLNACMRHGDIVKMACFAPVVNSRGAIFVHPKFGLYDRSAGEFLSPELNDFKAPLAISIANGAETKGTLETAVEGGKATTNSVVSIGGGIDFVKSGDGEWVCANGLDVGGSFALNGGTVGGVTMQNGSVLDFSARTTPLDLDTCGLAFASGATIYVAVGDRSITASSPLASWTAAPSGVMFKRDPAAPRRFRVSTAETGLYGAYVGMIISVY